jgi:hypothetical protein
MSRGKCAMRRKVDVAVRRQRKRMKCGICKRRTRYYVYDGFELWLGLTKDEARRCRGCCE